jgi:hypothetical protein
MVTVRSTDRLYAVTRRVAESEPWVHRLTVAAQGTLAVVVLVAAIATSAP